MYQKKEQILLVSDFYHSNRCNMYAYVHTCICSWTPFLWRTAEAVGSCRMHTWYMYLHCRLNYVHTTSGATISNEEERLGCGDGDSLRKGFEFAFQAATSSTSNAILRFNLGSKRVTGTRSVIFPRKQYNMCVRLE